MPDRRWLEDALNEYERPLVRYAFRLTGHLETARDIVQDCFLRLCQQTPGRVSDHVREWLFAVCRNRAIDHLRKEGRMDGLDAREPAALDTPVTHAEEREQQGEVLKCIDALPARQQEVLHLKFVDGLSYKQISAVTSVSTSNVGFLLHTALKTLRRRLGDQSRPAAGGRN